MNHVGYELTGPKRFVCRSEENLGPSGRYEVIDGTGRTLLEGTASRLEPAGSAGPWHYRGDFSAFRAAGGDFQVRFEAGGRIEASRRFGVGTSIFRRLTMPLVLEFLRSRRFARANYRGTGEWTPPGLLPDDEHFYDTGGGWFDVPSVAAASMRTGARAMWALFLAYQNPGRRSSRDAQRRREAEARDPQALEELRRGADWLKRLMIRYPESGTMISRIAPGGRIVPVGPDSAARAAPSGDAPWSSDEPHWAFLAGFLAAKISEALADTDLLRRGELFWEEYHDSLGGIDTREARSCMLLSETALHVATLQPTYLAWAERRVGALLDEVEVAGEGREREPDPGKLASWETPGASLPVAALTEFAGSLPDDPLTPRAKEAVGRFLDARAEAAKGDPFGLVPYSDSILREDEAVETMDAAQLRAEEAWLCLAAYRVTGRPAYVELATNAMNWILGLNPQGVCLLVRDRLLGAGARGAEGGALSLSDTASSGETAEAGIEGTVLASPDADATSARTAAAAAYLMALALI